MGNTLLRAVKDAVPSSPLSIAQRAALFWLANAAPDETALTWLGQEALADLIGCAHNYMGKTVAALVAAGVVTVWRRPGRVPLYLVHPQGIGALPPIQAKAVRFHMRNGRFSASEIGEAIAWLSVLGMVIGGANKTPQLSLGVSSKRATPQNSVGGDPKTELASTPKLSWAETKEKPNRNQRAERPPADAAELGADLAKLAAAPRPAPIASREVVRSDRSLWCGTPANVLAGLIEAGGKDADRLASMETGAALAEIARTQKLLRIPATIGRQ